jgi:uncharacterized protein (TIGR02145 family)
MAENLNHKVDGSKCGSALSGDGTLSDADAVACDKYGRLYNWDTAMGGAASSVANPSGIQGVCPSGWHLPSSAEWAALAIFAGGTGSQGGDGGTAGAKLKATSGWNPVGTPGTDDYGFSALPGGNGNSGGYFSSVGNSGYWWSASEDNGSDAYFQFMRYDYVNAYWLYDVKSSLFSVRCLQD